MLRLLKTTHPFFKKISYLIRYNWAVVQGAVKPNDEFRGLAYNDMVSIPIDEVEEMVLYVSKELGIPYLYVMDEMYYSDMTVLYAKVMNEKSFSSYNDYIHLEEEQKGKYVTDYGTPKPYIFGLLTPDVQEENIKKSNNSLRGLYRNGGKFND